MENNSSTEKTDQPTDKNSSSSPHDWRDHYGYRRHWFFPRMIVTLLVLGLAFMLGTMVSGHRAFRGGLVQSERFERPEFNQPLGGTMMGGSHHFGQRLLGSISAVGGNNLTVHNSAGDQTVVISDTTSIYKSGAIAKQTDLKVGDVITVTGQPNSSGQINATQIVIH